MEKGRIPPTVLVIFGVTGDLSRRYILPALEQIIPAAAFPDEFKVIGVSRRKITAEQAFGEGSKILQCALTFKMDFNSSADYQRLKEELQKVSANFRNNVQYVFYFALPPEATQPVVRSLGNAGFGKRNVKLLLEKPFGTDLSSAKKLISQTNKHFRDEQVYRIDHYLAKEMAQNLIIFLGGNVLFRNVWNNRYIDRIDIVAAESIGIEGRKGFYEQSGALRDIIQSHLMQLAALVLMKPCGKLFDFTDVPKHRLSAIEALKIADPKKTIRAQYEGYRDEVDNPQSLVETFVSLELESSDPRWRGVPIRLTSGKRLDKKLTAIDVYFKKDNAPQANKLTLKIQPDEGVELDLWVKEPGYSRNLQKRPLNFSYGQHFSRLPQAYEQILLDAFSSNHSLFASGEEVLASWEILQPVLRHWDASKHDLEIYKPGSSVMDILA